MCRCNPEMPNGASNRQEFSATRKLLEVGFCRDGQCTNCAMIPTQNRPPEPDRWAAKLVRYNLKHIFVINYKIKTNLRL